ncbi:MAG: hypothetical protein DRZ90_01560 [Spirochaetes bacterium]|nr:MAG: hypothetical protein DRZ90_01560 [Spirochaetota bacterium]
MKRPSSRIAILAFTVFLIPAAGIMLSAEVKFSGELKPELVFNIPGSGGYDNTPLNPGNWTGINDLMFRSEINLKLNAQGDTSALDLWFQVKQYPMADLLIGSAFIAETMNPGGAGALDEYSTAVADMFYIVDPYIFTLDIMRASASWMPVDSLRITLGRQSFLTGYGYGWNPVDLANPPKDPTDPEAYLRGVDALNIQYSPASWINTRFYGAVPSQGFAWGYEQMLAGAEITLSVPSLEFKLAGLYGGQESSSDAYDIYPHAGAAAFYLDILGLGVYGEGVVRSRSRRNIPADDDSPSIIKDGPVYSALAGLEYYFSSGLVLAAEYFYNGEGWNDKERKDYSKSLLDQSINEEITGEYLALYTPTYFARHNVLMNLMIPWYAIESNFNLNLIWSPDSASIILTPNAVFNLNYEGTLTSEIWYSGMYSYDDSQKNEAWLSPVKQSIWVNLRYYF